MTWIRIALITGAILVPPLCAMVYWVVVVATGVQLQSTAAFFGPMLLSVGLGIPFVWRVVSSGPRRALLVICYVVLETALMWQFALGIASAGMCC